LVLRERKRMPFLVLRERRRRMPFLVLRERMPPSLKRMPFLVPRLPLPKLKLDLLLPPRLDKSPPRSKLKTRRIPLLVLSKKKWKLLLPSPKLKRRRMPLPAPREWKRFPLQLLKLKPDVLKANRGKEPTCLLLTMVPTSATQRRAGRLESRHPSPPHRLAHHAPLNLQSVTLKRTFVASTLAIVMEATLK
jgi:hypothetical protein